MKNALEHFQSNNRVNDDNKKYKKCNMKKWYHCHEDRVQNDLETFFEKKICKLSSKNKKCLGTFNLSANVFLSHIGSTYLVSLIGT